MHLLSIELHGFKSFAEKTAIHFLPPKNGTHSITAIVGPNGSGKSNISDAIRWVLGEQSIKQLRGKKSADVIFGGGDGKGQMSMASVTLTFDTRDGMFPMDQETLVISRRLYRSGESEYAVNGQTVRLLDLQILLAKAQFAHGSYSVIGQGTIDQMLLQTPEERKTFFDEAAGIKEFQIKRHQAFLKLRRSKEHVLQADLLLNEMTPRLKSLSRQVKKLEQRQEVAEALREASEQYYAVLLSHYRSERDREAGTYRTVSETTEDIRGILGEKQQELAALASEASRHDAFAHMQTSLDDVMRKKYAFEQTIATLNGKLQIEYSRSGKHDVAWLERKIVALQKESEQLDRDIAVLIEKRNTLQSEERESAETIRKHEVALTESRHTLLWLDETLRDIDTRTQVSRVTGFDAVRTILAERNRFGTVYGTVAQLADTDDRFVTALDVAAGTHVRSLVVDTDAVAEKAIRYLREHRLGIATFLPLNTIEPRHIPQAIAAYASYPGVVGWAIDLARFDRAFSNIFSFVLGGTLVVEDTDTARAIGIGRVRMVTLDGDLLERGGSIKGGFRKPGAEGMSFGLKSALPLSDAEADGVKEKQLLLAETVRRLEADIVAEKEHERTIHSEVAILSEKESLLRAEYEQKESERAALEQELSLATMTKDDYTVALSGIREEKVQVENARAAMEREVVAAQAEMNRFHEEEEQKKRRVFALQDEMQTLQDQLRRVSDTAHAAEIEMAKYDTKLEDAAHELSQELHTTADNLLARVAPHMAINQLADIEAEMQKLKYKLSLIGGIDQEVVDEYRETKTRHDDLADDLDDLHKTIVDLETMIAELDQVMKKKRDVAFKKIRKEFQRYFHILFDGGKADLVELYGDALEVEEDGESVAAEDVDAPKKQYKKKEMLLGIDVVASPPGKKIANIQALSGGERTLVSIALVSAILSTNPAPFVVLDEVEAALDEANTLRFTKILQELVHQSQFILITHNRASMHAADALYGVTMGNDGMSKLVSVKMEE